MALIHETIAQRYASSLFEFASEQKCDDVCETELKDLVALVQDNQNLLKFFSSPLIPADAKKDLIESVTAALKLSKPMQRFAALLVHNDRLALIDKIHSFYMRKLEDSRNHATAIVTSTTQVSEKTKVKLKVLLEKYFDKSIDLSYEINNDLLGGIMVRIDNQIIDHSLKGELERMKEALIKEG